MLHCCGIVFIEYVFESHYLSHHYGQISPHFVMLGPHTLIIKCAYNDNNNDDDDDNNNDSDKNNNDNDVNNKLPVDSPHKGPIILSFDDVTFVESKKQQSSFQ